MSNKEIYIRTVIIGSLFVIAFGLIAIAMSILNKTPDNTNVPTAVIVCGIIGTVVFMGTMIFTIITTHKILRQKKII